MCFKIPTLTGGLFAASLFLAPVPASAAQIGLGAVTEAAPAVEQVQYGYGGPASGPASAAATAMAARAAMAGVMATATGAATVVAMAAVTAARGASAGAAISNASDTPACFVSPPGPAPRRAFSCASPASGSPGRCGRRVR